MNVSQIIEEINKDLDDSLDNSDAIGWINRCLDELTPITKKETKKEADIVETNAYELPTDLFEMVTVMENGIELDPVPLRDTYSKGYKVWDNVLSVQKGETSGLIDLYYYRRLAQVSTVDDTPEIDSTFHDLFILYTVAYSQFAEEEPERQADAMSRYESRKAQYQEFVTRNSFAMYSSQIVPNYVV